MQSTWYQYCSGNALSQKLDLGDRISSNTLKKSTTYQCTRLHRRGTSRQMCSQSLLCNGPRHVNKRVFQKGTIWLYWVFIQSLNSSKYRWNWFFTFQWMQKNVEPCFEFCLKKDDFIILKIWNDCTSYYNKNDLFGTPLGSGMLRCTPERVINTSN